MAGVDYGTLGVAGLIAATLAVILRVIWTAYLAKDKELAARNADYTKLLVDLTVTLGGLKQVIEGQDRVLREVAGNVPRH